jgi:ABC-type multidrug transport system ATPase subunit
VEKINNMTINLNKLRLTFNDKSEILNSNIINISSGDAVVVMGRNGSGKSTLLNFLYGKISNVKIFGDSEVLGFKIDNNIKVNEIANLRNRIIFHKQNNSFDLIDRILVKDYVINLIKMYDIKNVNFESIINNFNIKFSKYTNYSINKYSKLSSLSGGQTKLFQIYTSLLLKREPQLILLDEPINHLDLIGIKLLNNLLLEYKNNNPNIIIIIITHFNVFTFINKLLGLNNNKLDEIPLKNINSNNIGLLDSQIDENGFYLI